MHSGSLNDKVKAEGALSGALMQLMAVSENYPQLRANENFKQLQMDLSDLENKIAAARRFFNNAVAEYNASIEQFPAVLLARPLGFQPATMFELDASEKAAASQPPQVKF